MTNPAKPDDATPSRRRRERSPRAAGTTFPLEPLPPLRMPWATLNLFRHEDALRIIDTSYCILDEAGLEIRSARARELYRRHGCVVDEAAQMVRMGRDIVQACCGKAPRSFVLHARNPRRSLHIGGDGASHFACVHGPPHVSGLGGGRRYATLEDLRNIIKVTHALGVTHYRPGVIVEPTDRPVASRHLDIYQAQIELSDTL